MTPRRLATFAALAATTLTPLATPAGASPDPVSTVVTTSGGTGAARLEAACHFGPVVPDNFEDQMVVTGVATAPGAVYTTVRCSLESSTGGRTVEATAAAPAVTVHDTLPHWRSATRVCVSAEANFGRVLGTVFAPKVCA